MKYLILLPLIIYIGFIDSAQAQDLIIKTNKDTISCIIKEVGDDEIKFLRPSINETVLFGINKDKVKKVVFNNGNEITFSKYLFDPENYEADKKRNIKVNFLSPLFNSFNICYEKSIKPERSFETTLGIIGAGWDIGEYNEAGAFIKAGYKFIKSPNFHIRGQRYAHILKGGYLKPEIAISYYKYDNYFYYSWIGLEDEWQEETNLMFAVLLNIGKQWIFENGLLFDWFIGVGYGFGDDNEGHGTHKAFVGGTSDTPLAATMGIRIGWNF